ncbi:AAA family ATPase [Aerococcaceae bacterium NML180378]|nr:AAA family ATPase [Aerococcaceae bacterium NML180378]
MKIKQLDIYGYGKWVNQRFEIDDKLQLFYGQNEAGKSTLQSFIRSMLFGFPTKRRRVNQLNRFEPRNSDVYGGRLLLADTKCGDIWIERTRKRLTITTIEGEVLPTKVLDEVLSGLDETLFDNFYAFSLQNLQELANIDATQLNDYFLSIGTVGSDKFLKIAKDFQKETDDLYRPQGQSRPLNQLLNEYDQLAQSVQKLAQNLGRYDSLVERRNEEEQKIATLNQEINELEQELREQDKLVGRYDVYLKARAAKRELEQLVPTPISEETIKQLEQALKDNQASRDSLIQLDERVRNLTGELGTLTKLNWANNHEAERKQWIAETRKVKDTQASVEVLTNRIKEQKEIMVQLAHRGQFFPEKVSQSEEYVQKVEEGIAIQARKAEVATEQEVIKAERKVYLEQRKEQQNASMLARQQVAKLENQRMNEEAQLMQATSLNQYFFGGLFALIGVAVMVAMYLADKSFTNGYFIAGAILAGLGLASVLYIFREHRKQFVAFRNSPILAKIQDLREKEGLYQEQSQAIGLQINQREEQLEALNQEMLKANAEQSRWLGAIGFYPTADPEIVLKTDPVKQYFDAKALLEQFETQKSSLETQVREWRQLVQPIFERFPLVDDDIRQAIRHAEDVEVALTRTQERGATLQNKLDDAKQQIEEHTQGIATREAVLQTIFEETDSRNEMEFYQKVEINERIDELTTKHDLYLEQMEGYEEALAQIENKQTLLETYHRLEHQLETAKERLVPHHHERANLVVEINHLEQDGTYQERVQQLEDKKEAVRQSVLEWGRKRIAMELIYQTLRQGMDNPIPEMNRLADEIFETLSYGRYTQIKLNKTGIKVKQFSDVLFEPHELSQGTLEQLYVALRLAFVENVRTMVKMPILIDDAFVNFDEHRKASMYQVLSQVSEKTQVLFFTFDQQAREAFAQANRIDLEECNAEAQPEEVEV